MSVRRKLLTQIVTLTVICVIAVFGYISKTIETSSPKIINDKTIIIDAGHPELVRHYRFSDLPPNM